MAGGNTGLTGHLIQIDAAGRDGLAAPRRFASMDVRELCHFRDQEWVPAIARLPVLRHDFFGGDFNGQITTPTASFTLVLDRIADFGALRWSGARVRVWSGPLGVAFDGWELRFDGRLSAAPTVENGIASFTAKPDDAWLDKPLLDLFTGTGQMEGPIDLEGSVKPLALGVCRLVPGVLVDPVDTVYRISAYGPLEDIAVAYDRMTQLTGPIADYPDMDGLLAAAIPQGKWASCKAFGLARLGAPPDGAVCFDISGDAGAPGGTVGFARTPGAMIARLAELAGGTVDAESLADLDRARPWNLSLYLNSQQTARRVIQELADSVVAVPMVGWTGKLIVKPLGFGPVERHLNSDGSTDPMVADVSEQAVASPFWRLACNAELTWRVHSQSEIAFTAAFNMRGPYAADRTYREGDIVTTSDGSQYLYIYPDATSGNAPPDGTYWFQLSAPVGTAANIIYIKASGKPAAPPPSEGIPAGWADEISGTGAANLPVWASFGTKGPGDTLWTWSEPTAAVGDKRLWDAVDTNGSIKNNQVGTGAIVDNGVTTPWLVTTSSPISVSYPNTVTALSLTVNKTQSGSLLEVMGQIPLVGASGSSAVVCKIWYRILQGSTVVAQRDFAVKVNGNATTRLPLAFEQFWGGLAAGTYTVQFQVEATDSSASMTSDGLSHLRVREYKK